MRYLLLWMVALWGLVACQSPLPTGTGTPVTQPVTQVVVTPGGVLLTGTGQTRALSARVLGAGGEARPSAVTWQSSRPEVVSVDASGTVTARAGLGSALITAEADGVRSVPLLVVVAQPEPGAALLRDEQILTAPVQQAPADLGVGTRFSVSVRGAGTLTPGTVVLSQEGRAVAGRVVSAAVTADPDVQDVLLEVVPVAQLFRRLSVQETFDLSGVEPVVTAAGLSATRLPGGGWQLGPPLGAQAKFNVGKFACQAEGGLEGATSLLSTKFEQTLAFEFALDITEDDVVQHLRLAASGGLNLEATGGLKFNTVFQGELDCKLPLLNIPVPVTGPLAAVLAPTVPVGLKFGLKGEVAVNIFEAGLEGKLQPTLTLGLDYKPASGFVNLSAFTPGAALSPRLTFLGETFPRFQAETAFQATAGIGIGNTLFTFEVVQVALGPRLTVGLGTVGDQANDAGFQAQYGARFAAEFGPGQDVLDAMEIIFGSPQTVNLTLSSALLLGQSPSGTASADRNTVQAGDAVTFKVTLDPANTSFFPGTFNVKELRIYRRDPVPGGQSPLLVASAPGVAGVTEYLLPWTATGDDVVQGRYFAYVVPEFLGLVPLKLGPVSAAGAPAGPLLRPVRLRYTTSQVSSSFVSDPESNTQATGATRSDSDHTITLAPTADPTEFLITGGSGGRNASVEGVLRSILPEPVNDPNALCYYDYTFRRVISSQEGVVGLGDSAEYGNRGTFTLAADGSYAFDFSGLEANRTRSETVTETYTPVSGDPARCPESSTNTVSGGGLTSGFSASGSGQSEPGDTTLSGQINRTRTEGGTTTTEAFTWEIILEAVDSGTGGQAAVQREAARAFW